MTRVVICAGRYLTSDIQTYPTLDTKVSDSRVIWNTKPSGMHYWYESRWNLGTTLWSVYGNRIYGREIVPWKDYTITGVIFNLYREGSPGTVTLYFHNCASHEPSGGALDTGTTNGDTLPEAPSTEERLISLSTGVSLTTGNHYCFYIEASAGDSDNNVHIRSVDYGCSDRGFGGAYGMSSLDGGTNWTTWATPELVFEETGTLA